MVKAIGAVLLALELGAGFGAASAELFSTSGNAMEIELRVEVKQSAETVVAHLSFEDDAPIALPLVQRESGVFGIRTELAKKNYRVIFEIVAPAPARSEQRSLMELGLDIPIDQGTSATDITGGETPLSERTRGWGWLALALGAAALSALAFWALGGRDDNDHDSPASPSNAAEDSPDA